MRRPDEFRPIEQGIDSGKTHSLGLCASDDGTYEPCSRIREIAVHLTPQISSVSVAAHFANAAAPLNCFRQVVGELLDRSASKCRRIRQEFGSPHGHPDDSVGEAIRHFYVMKFTTQFFLRDVAD